MLSCFLAKFMILYCSSIFIFFNKPYVEILLEIRLFVTEKDSPLVIFRACCCFLWNRIHHPCCCIPFLLLVIFSWCITLHCNVRGCWTFVQDEIFLPLTICLNFFLLLFIIYLQSLLSQRASDFALHSHCCALPFSKMAKNYLATTFLQWEGSERKDCTAISSPIFPLYDFRTWPRLLLYEWLSTACIAMSLSLSMA